MSLVPFELPPGVVKDGTDRITPGRWYDANLVRWRSGDIEPIGGWAQVATTPTTTVPRALFQWSAANNTKTVGVGCDGKFYILQGSTLTDITPDGFVVADQESQLGGYGTGTYGTDLFGTGRLAGQPAFMVQCNYVTMANWGEDLILSSSKDGRLFYWDASVGGKATLITADTSGNIPISNRGMIVYERFLIVIGADGDPRRVAWSQVEDFRNFNYADTTGNEGFQDLDTQGQLCALKIVNEGVLLFSDADVWLMRFTGAPFDFSFTKVSSDSSLVCPYAVTTYNGKAVWMTRKGFMKYDGGAVEPLPCDIGAFINNTRDEFFGRVRTHASANGVFPEVWWWFPSTGSSEADSYAVWNYDDNCWYPGKMVRTCSIPGTINYYRSRPMPMVCFGITRTEMLFYQSVGEIFVESGAIEPIQGQVVQANQFLADSAYGAQISQFTFYTSLTPDGNESAKGPYIPRKDGYTDIRFSARSFRVHIKQIASGHWTIGSSQINIVQRGTR